MPPEKQTNQNNQLNQVNTTSEIDPTPDPQGRTPLSEFMSGDQQQKSTQTQQTSVSVQQPQRRPQQGGSEIGQFLQDSGPNRTQTSTSQQAQEDERGFLQKAQDFILPGTRGFGESIAGSIFPFTGQSREIEEGNRQTQRLADRVIEEIQEARKSGEDTERLENAAANLVNKGFIDREQINKSLQKTRGQIAGEALGTAASTIGFGSLPAAGRFAAGGGSFLSGLGRGAAVGAGEGAIFGATEGFAGGLREGKTASEAAKRAGTGALIGTAAGGVLGGAAGGIGGALAGRQARKAELETLINNRQAVMRPKEGLPQSSVVTTEDTSRFARFMEGEGGQAVADEDARKVLQGAPNVDESSIVAIKTASDVDKETKFPDMIDIAQRASANRRVVERPTDVVGETFTDYSKKITEGFDEARQRLDEAAQTLENQNIDVVGAENQFIDELRRRGVSVDQQGNITDNAFKRSDFEDMPQVERLIRNVDERLKTVQDAEDAHRLKKFIDNQVEYGSQKEGLVGDAESLVKQLRRNVDQQLDTRFPEYNEANTEVSQLINTIDEMGKILGTNFNLRNVDEAVNQVRAGQAARRILGNSQKRGEILQALEVVQDQAKKYGAGNEGDIVSQTIFADILEDIYGTQATTGFQGGIERGAREGIQESADVMRGFMQQGVRGAGGALIQKGARALGGTTQDEVTESLRRLIQR